MQCSHIPCKSPDKPDWDDHLHVIYGVRVLASEEMIPLREHYERNPRVSPRHNNNEQIQIEKNMMIL